MTLIRTRPPLREYFGEGWVSLVLSRFLEEGSAIDFGWEGGAARLNEAFSQMSHTTYNVPLNKSYDG